MRVGSRAMVVLAVLLGGLTVSVAPAGAAGSVTVTPSAGLVDLDSVTITGSGFNPGLVAFCQGVDFGTPSSSICGGAIGTAFTETGDFSTSYTVHRFMFVPALNRRIDCTVEQCVIAVAEVSDVAGTAVLTPISFAPPPPPPATPGSITITADGSLATGDVIIVNGTGFRPGADIVVLQCHATATDLTDCNPGGPGPVFTTADLSGAFTVEFVVTDFIVTPPFTDCTTAPGICVVAAAEVDDVISTIVSHPLTFAPRPQPDGQIRRGGPPLGDNIYNTTGEGQTRSRIVEPGTQLVLEVLVQNDAAVSNDIIVTSGGIATFAIPTRYFIDHDDVTSSVSLFAGGNGFTFKDMAPGETRRMTIRYSVDQNAPNGTVARNLVRLTSALDPIAEDLVVIEVQVQASTG